MLKKFLHSFSLQMLVAMVLGVVLGIVFGEKVAWMGEFAKLLVNFIKALATPLLFFAILDAVLESQIRGKGFASMLGISFFDSFLAVVIGLVITDTVRPGSYLVGSISTVTSGAPAAGKAFSWKEAISQFIPDSVVGPFVNNMVPAVIVIAILLGLAVRTAGKEKAHQKHFVMIQDGTKLALASFFILIGWVVKLVPLLVLGSIAKVVGSHGAAVVTGLGAFFFSVIAGMLIHILVVYQGWIKLVARRSLVQFWRQAKEPVIYAFGVNSSLATLPVTLKSLDNLKVSPGSARLSACIGTNFNNDGILLYEVMAGMFVAQACGIEFTILEQLALAAMAVIAAIGVAGFPEAGIISLTLVLSAMKLPADAITLLLTVDWILARSRSVVNVLGDMTVAIALDSKRWPGLADKAR